MAPKDAIINQTAPKNPNPNIKKIVYFILIFLLVIAATLFAKNIEDWFLTLEIFLSDRKINFIIIIITWEIAKEIPLNIVIFYCRYIWKKK